MIGARAKKKHPREVAGTAAGGRGIVIGGESGGRKSDAALAQQGRPDVFGRTDDAAGEFKSGIVAARSALLAHLRLGQWAAAIQQLRGIDTEEQRQDQDSDQAQAAAAEHHAGAKPAAAAAIAFTTTVLDILGRAKVIQAHACSIFRPLTKARA